ncbi:MAG: hypothetical protein GY799_19740 [Desulfobulbaceae bacterium]|nr:hypothetical protein [Desulfobulbaceae bacterium]
MEKLTAVNYLLGILGHAPVGALTNKNPDVSISEDALDAAILSVTSKGYWFNEVYNITLTPDPGTSEIDMAGYYKFISRNTYAVIVNGQLFDPKNNVYTFEQAVTGDGIKALTFEELPESVQEAVKYFAGVQLCTTDLEDTVKRNELQEFYNNAFIQMKSEELEIKRINQVTGTPRVHKALYRVRPARLSNRRGPNFGGR